MRTRKERHLYEKNNSPKHIHQRWRDLRVTHLLAAGTSDGALNFSDNALLHPQPAFITFDASVAELKEEKTLVSELL